MRLKFRKYIPGVARRQPQEEENVREIQLKEGTRGFLSLVTGARDLWVHEEAHFI